MRISTTWTKYIIPIPDPYKLTLEKGVLFYATGPENNNGYTFWIDELQFEKLGTIAQPKPAILNGADVFQTSFIGSSIDLSTGLSQTVNLASGINETVIVAPGYFTFSSTDVDVARVSESGIVSVVGKGTAKITAILAGVKAEGSLTVEVLGQFNPAPIPSLDPGQVISIFSDAYANVPVDFYNGYYAPFQTTTSNDFEVNGDRILNYENYNFVGIEFNQNVPTINATEMTRMHLDIFIPDSFDPASTIRINLVDFGSDAAFGGGDDSSVSTTVSVNSTPALITGQWISIELDITGLANRNNLGQIVFDAAGDTTPRPSSFYVDNIYLHK
ncbi:MAG: glycosyl hydrolase family 16 [Flavobacteriaceae bacterium]|nr:glycosyl hydrolase family 16 [Flavobacteriaceae bacterium]